MSEITLSRINGMIIKAGDLTSKTCCLDSPRPQKLLIPCFVNKALG